MHSGSSQPTFVQSKRTVGKQLLSNLAKQNSASFMTTMNISLPDALKEFVDQKVATAGYGTSSEYVRELIRHDRDRLRLRNLLLEGAQSKSSGPADADYFASLRSDQEAPGNICMKALVRRERADLDVQEAVENFLQNAPEYAFCFIDALEQAYSHIQRQPGTGSPRYAHELNLPGLRF